MPSPFPWAKNYPPTRDLKAGNPIAVKKVERVVPVQTQFQDEKVTIRSRVLATTVPSTLMPRQQNPVRGGYGPQKDLVSTSTRKISKGRLGLAPALLLFL